MEEQDSVSPPQPGGARLSKQGAARIVLLDRPDRRNALDRATTAELSTIVPHLARDHDSYAVVLRSSRPGAFCAGGDVRELAQLACTDITLARAILAAEYRMIWLLECFSKPVVALIDGGVMGGGAGMTLVNTHRVAAEDYWFAMPEVQIGLFPDDGVAHRLARLPGAIGIYLALTGRKLARADAFALGLVTHCIDARHFDEITARLADASPVDPLLGGYHRPPGPGALEPYRAAIEDCFSTDSLAEIDRRLAILAGRAGNTSEWAAAARADIRRAAPLSAAITLRHVGDARDLDLRQTLTIDYRLAHRMIAANDFAEGVRARFIAREEAAAWHPRSIEEVSTSLVDDHFKWSPETTLILPTRQEMQAARV